MKTIALDIGDVWTGVAISDALGMLARPLTTVKTTELNAFLHDISKKERISTIVVGNPITMKGTASAQTEKLLEIFNALQQEFSQLNWKLWDERLSSKRAEQHMKSTSKEEKIRSHSVAAAFILSTYLDHQRMQIQYTEDFEE